MPDLWDSGEPSEDEYANVFAYDADAAASAVEAAEAAGREPPEAAVAVAEGEQPRDEKGRFAPKEEQPPAGASAEEGEEAPAEEQTPEPPADDPLAAFLAKYGGDERKALEAAMEAQSTIGGMANEIGQLRALIQQQQELQQQPQYPPTQQQYDWDSLIDENPAYATQLAAAEGNEVAYRQAVQAWDEISPGAPQLWYKQQQIDAALAQIATSAREREGEQMVAALMQKYPDLGDYQEKMQEIAARFPHELAALASSDMSVAAPALESLYLKARSPDSATLAQQAEEIARKQTEAELRARDEAAVASATRSHVTPPPSKEEAIAADWYTKEDRLAEGWNIS